MSTEPTEAGEISLPLRMYFTAQDAPHWSKGGDEQSRTVHRAHRNHRFAEMVEKLKRLVHAAHEARSLDASGMSMEGAKHLEITADAAHTAIRLFIQDVERAAERYRQAELDAHTAAVEGFSVNAVTECNETGPEGESCIRKPEHKGEHLDGFHSGGARWPQASTPPAPEPVDFKPTASPAEVAARAIADLKAQRARPAATVTELRYTSESKR